MKQRFMLDTNAVRLLLERRSLQLDQWFAEDRCSLSAIVEPVANVYGQWRADLQRLGITLAAMDLLIASHALALDRTLVSHDQVFASVPGLLCCPAC